MSGSALLSQKTDKEITEAIADWVDLQRRKNGSPDNELAEQSGVSVVTISKFRNHKTNISLDTFVRLLRGIERLDVLEAFLQESLDKRAVEKVQIVEKPKSPPPLRIRSRKNKQEASGNIPEHVTSGQVRKPKTKNAPAKPHKQKPLWETE